MRTPHDVSRRTGKPVAAGLAAIVIGASAFIGGTAVPAIAAPAAPAAPAPGVPHDPVVLIREDFEQDGANATIRGLDTYTGANGETYTADASWLQDCNGWLSRGSHPDNAATQVTDCANQNGWNAVQRLSIALGLNDGLSSSAALENIGVAAYTQDNPTTGRMLESVTPLVVPVTGRYVTMSVDTAVVNCFAAHPSLRFELTPTGGSAITVANNLDPCNQPAVTGTIPTIGVNSTASSDFRVGTVTGKASTKVTASGFGVRLSNNTLTGGGNDFAFDNLTILDVTPRIDHEFVDTTIQPGGTTKVRFTITNSSELGSKENWRFAGQLPTGLTRTGTVTSDCPGLTEAISSTTGAYDFTADLDEDLESCTIEFDVVASTAGTYNLNQLTMGTIDGLDGPGTDTLTVGTPATTTAAPTATTLSIKKAALDKDFSKVGQRVGFRFDVTNNSTVTVTDVAVKDPLIPTVACATTTLAPKQSTTCVGAYVTTAGDVTRGRILNVASVTGKTPNGAVLAAVSSNEVRVPIAVGAGRNARPSELAYTGNNNGIAAIVSVALIGLGGLAIGSARRKRLSAEQ